MLGAHLVLNWDRYSGTDDAFQQASDELLENGEPPPIMPVTYQELDSLEPPNFTGFKTFYFTITDDTGLVRIWILMPEGRPYEDFDISGYPIGQPELAEIIVPTTTVDLPIAAIATFELINPKHNDRYVCRWRWIEEVEPE